MNMAIGEVEMLLLIDLGEDKEVPEPSTTRKPLEKVKQKYIKKKGYVVHPPGFQSKFG